MKYYQWNDYDATSCFRLVCIKRRVKRQYKKNATKIPIRKLFQSLFVRVNVSNSSMISYVAVNPHNVLIEKLSNHV